MKKWDKTKGPLKTALLVVCLFLLGSLDLAAQARLDVPRANLEVSNAVPLPLIKKIALEKSKETWGPGALGEPIPLSNLDGEVVVYMVPYRIGKGEFPGYDDILDSLQAGRNLKTLLKNSDVEKAREVYKKSMRPTKAASQRPVVVSESRVPRRPPINPVRPDGSISRRKEMEEMKEIQTFAARKAIGADEFGTIFVSATYDTFPVLAYFHYLSPYYVNFGPALEKAEEVIGRGASLKSIYFLGLQGQHFEFARNGSGVVLNSKTLEITSLEALRGSRISEGAPRTDSTLFQERKAKRETELAKEWKKIKAEIGDE
jgi:hypothetical protein